MASSVSALAPAPSVLASVSPLLMYWGLAPGVTRVDPLGVFPWGVSLPCGVLFPWMALEAGGIVAAPLAAPVAPVPSVLVGTTFYWFASSVVFVGRICRSFLLFAVPSVGFSTACVSCVEASVKTRLQLWRFVAVYEIQHMKLRYEAFWCCH